MGSTSRFIRGSLYELLLLAKGNYVHLSFSFTSTITSVIETMNDTIAGSLSPYPLLKRNAICTSKNSGVPELHMTV